MFAALSEAEHVSRWFCDEAEVERGVGGRIVMRWSRPGAIPYHGRWVEFDPPRACAHEGGNHAYPDGVAGRVGFALTAEADGGTRLSILHRIPAGPRYEPFLERHRAAWPQAIARLEAYLSPSA